MSIRTVSSAQIIVGSFDASGFVGNIEEVPGTVSTSDVTTFADGGFSIVVPSIKAGMYRFSGYCDHASTGISAAITPDNMGTQYGVSVAVPASGTAVVVGDHAEFGTGVLSQLVPMSADLQSAGAMSMGFATDSRFAMRGFVGAPLAARTTTYTGDALALTGPSATQRMVAILHVTATTGTNLAVKVQSDDNSGFTSATDRITFSTVSAVGWQTGYVAGDLSTETHWRVTATVGSGSFTWAAYIGVL